MIKVMSMNMMVLMDLKFAMSWRHVKSINGSNKLWIVWKIFVHVNLIGKPNLPFSSISTRTAVKGWRGALRTSDGNQTTFFMNF